MSIYLLPVVFLITMHGIRATLGIIEKIFFITIIWVVPIQAIAHPLVLNIKYSTINIGYIRYESFSAGVGDGNLDEVLYYLQICNGLIIDVRDNGGGNLTNSSRIAARFTDKLALTGYIQHKTGPGHNDFSEMEPIYLEPSNSIRWQKSRDTNQSSMFIVPQMILLT